MPIAIADAFKPLIPPKRYKVYFGGRGGAKSWGFAQILILKAAEQKLRILCTREFQGSIRESVHKLLAETIDRLGLSSFYRVEKQGIFGRNGTHFLFEGLKNNITKIKSVEGVDICWCEEAEAITENSWDILIPTIRQKDSEIWVSFNPASETDNTYERFIVPYLDTLDAEGVYSDETIHVQRIGWRENPWFPEELRKEMETCKRDNHNKYLHIWEGETKAAVEGAIYGEQLEAAKDRIMNIPIVSGVPVHTFWDLGINDTTAIIFMQCVGREYRIVDCYEGRMQGLDHYARILREKGYLYGSHYLPHDVDVHELSTNTTRKQTLAELGVKPIKVVKRIRHLSEGIEQTRQAFSQCYFDRERCGDLIKALRNYQYTWDEQYSVFRERPLHNWASNYADAFRQLGTGFSPSTGAFNTEDWNTGGSVR